eukprot:395264-Rhodomonas_salina.1
MRREAVTRTGSGRVASPAPRPLVSSQLPNATHPPSFLPRRDRPHLSTSPRRTNLPGSRRRNAGRGLSRCRNFAPPELENTACFVV